ncbi:MAG: hypothetical protein AAFP92_24225, partial [Bacteroidota bacterium]
NIENKSSELIAQIEVIETELTDKKKEIDLQEGIPSFRKLADLLQIRSILNLSYPTILIPSIDSNLFTASVYSMDVLNIVEISTDKFYIDTIAKNDTLLTYSKKNEASGANYLNIKKYPHKLSESSFYSIAGTNLSSTYLLIEEEKNSRLKATLGNGPRTWSPIGNGLSILVSQIPSEFYEIEEIQGRDNPLKFLNGSSNSNSWRLNEAEITFLNQWTEEFFRNKPHYISVDSKIHLPGSSTQDSIFYIWQAATIENHTRLLFPFYSKGHDEESIDQYKAHPKQYFSLRNYKMEKICDLIWHFEPKKNLKSNTNLKPLPARFRFFCPGKNLLFEIILLE